MCRVLAYLGRPVLLDDLLFLPDNSLVRQAYAPQMAQALNLAGFGTLAWDPMSNAPAEPFAYRTLTIPIFDPNLRGLARKIRPSAALAHVRGVPFSETEIVSHQNLHPFRFEGVPLAMAHNGDLACFGEMKPALVEHIRPELARRIVGTTDSEWVYALILSQLADPAAYYSAMELRDAVDGALGVLRKLRAQFGICTTSPVNLFLCDGNHLVVTRFTFDFGCYDDELRPAALTYTSLWYTFGREYGFHDDEWKMIGGHDDADAVIVASEPLTRDTSSWLEVPEYALLSVSRSGGEFRMQTLPLDA